VLVHRETTLDELERMARAYREHDERDRLKQQQMIEYAERRGCRWEYLVNYFGQDDAAPDTCGHCDSCAPLADSPTLVPGPDAGPALRLVS
jgi:ATP-dependent DNA helicase RecQ